jgi:four helix bundle protein
VTQVKNFRDVKVWNKSHDLALAVYRATAKFPAEERFGLTSQMRRSSTSIPTNVAEGCGRDGDRELTRFLQMAMGSASELEYQIMLAHDLNLLGAEAHETLTQQVTEVKRMLASFTKKLRADR